MKKIYTLALSLFFVTSIIAQTSENNSDDPLLLEASYTCDNVSNLAGGIKTGYGYLGMATIRIGFDTEKAGLWKGGQLFVNAANTHGATPSADLLGDMQVASNIEAGNHTYLQEFWLKQAVGHVELTVGLQDLNVEFANSEHGALFLNSSFGILPIISGNVAAPIFPLTSLGLTAKWNITEKTSWLNAAYDGSPTDFDYNPHNIKWEFVSGDGLLAISELQQSLDIVGLPGTYKLGIYSHSHIVENNFNSTLADSLNYNTFGAYVYADQKVWAQAERSLGFFVQAGYSPSKISVNNAYIGIGANLTGMLSKAKDDVLGLAVAHENFNNGLGSETTIELTWQKQLFRNIFIQPDLQYIIKPSGKNSGLENCLAGIIRLGLAF
ncbi:MAG TPA: carbohydrate porin [Bacteroidales bacterium]|nr:carbohydrate porin [Bacteroidales bacterium]